MCCNSSATDYISMWPLFWIKNRCRPLQAGVLPGATISICASNHIPMRVSWDPRGSQTTLVSNLKSTQRSTTSPDVKFLISACPSHCKCFLYNSRTHNSFVIPNVTEMSKEWKSFSTTTVPLVQCYFYVYQSQTCAFWTQLHDGSTITVPLLTSKPRSTPPVISCTHVVPVVHETYSALRLGASSDPCQPTYYLCMMYGK
jgi:hypothetical protein